MGILSKTRRWQGGVLATFVLLACTAATVVAAEHPVEDRSGEESLVGQATSSVDLPDAEDVQAGLEAAAAEEAERERWLQSTEAVRQREESRYAFADLSAAEAKQLLLTVFAEELATLNNEPARWLSDAGILTQHDPTAATVQKEGKTLLLDADVPLRAPDEQGESRKLDLELQGRSGAFEPANSLTELRIPDQADDPIAVGSEGLAIRGLGAERDRGAQPLGEMNLFYPDALGEAADTDRLVSPTSSGVEVFDLLRSADSPETLRFELDLPEGATLAPDGNGGATITRGEEQIASIPFPHAIDAQGTVVPVDLEVQGKTISLHIAHREADLAYPILLDPTIVEDWYNYSWAGGHNFQVLENGTWTYSENSSWIENGTSCIVTCFWSYGRGLYIGMKSGNHSPDQWGQWLFSAPNSSSFLANAWVNPFLREDYNCGGYGQPHDYVGMWHNGAWNTALRINQAKIYGYTETNGWGSTLVIGMGTGGGVNIPCRRDLAVGGTAIWEGDWQDPSINSVSGIPGGWFGDEAPLNISVSTQDAGLGVHRVKVFNSGKSIVDQDTVGNCSGLAGNRCPTSRNSSFSPTGDSFGEGIRGGSITVDDPLGKTAETFFTTKVDNSKPEVALEGQLAEATGEEVGFGEGENPVGEGEDELRLPVYELQIKAKDGDPAEDKTKRSGVKSIEVFLDGSESPEQSWLQSCGGPNYSCPMTQTYTLELSEIDTAGEHELEVKAEDFVGEVKERTIEFEYFPATGMKDSYVMHYFPLPDGQGNEEEEEHPARPELAVNVMNGNLVYRERDIDVEGPAVDLEVERFYNSQLPEEEDTEWGDGWTLAQTPELKPAEGAEPAEAELLEASGALEDEVELPMAAEEEKFDPELQATLTKKASGGYELTDETGEEATSVAFDETGQAEARLTGGFAKLDYDYEGGELAEIAVSDPGSAGNPTEPPAGEGEEEAAPDGPPAYGSTFGSNGSGDGQLKSPGDVAIDAQGDIWVADKANNRIQQFSPEGQFISKFGAYGSGDGQLNIPTSLTIDAAGNILVTERGNDRVQKFSPSGEFLDKFGSYGTGNGQFNGPEGIAIDAEGDIWVSDTYSGRVQEFDSGGEFLQVVGSKGSGEGQIGEPTGIDIDPSGNLWVADWQNNRVEVFDEEGGFLDQFGSQGTGEGQFNRPDALDIDEAGNVWVGDQNNDRIQRFDLAAQFVDQFGEGGSGEGQFNFGYPMGLEAKDGHIWIADVNNHRVQEWVVPGAKELFTAHGQSVGSQGSEPGELSSPADVAIDDEGGLWIADRGNDRIQHFDAEGGFVSQFGSSGSGDGQLSEPAGIDLDPEGNVWVADAGNDRVQKFSPEGEFLSKFGSTGSENGQFDEPVGIAYAPNLLGVGGIYVADRGNHRIQLFGSGGGYWGAAGSYGSGEKQLIEPSGVALGGPHGESGFTLLIADSGNHRIQRWTWGGAFVNQFGTLGAGKGQLNRPEAVDVDEQGTVWVGDRVNDRVEAFDEGGKSLGEFGSQGSGEEELELTFPIGIAASEGDVVIADSGNDRLQRWQGFLYSPGGEEGAAPEDDPKVEVQTPGGLVASVAGAEAGEHEYSHEGELLVSHDGPEGETAYDYDEGDRLSKVTLPNGTWGEIDYYADGRVKEITVDPEGEEPAKSTLFTYKDDTPRRTTVEPPDAPHVVYDIGEDGSVLKWWNAEAPPEIDIDGTLYDNREEDGALWAGDHWLEAEAESAEGIASIEIILDGDTLVDEKTCEQDPELEGKECTKEIHEWVTSTDLNSPGHLQVEVLVTDAIGGEASERFWVDIPEPPPPLAPGTPVPPRFHEIAQFRQDYGLEVVFPVSGETELNERIFNLIKAWHEPNTAAGQVARSSWERWGVPLRAEDVAELEYRNHYVSTNGDLVDMWGEELHPESYAGYYVDHRAGGLMRVGFTSDQAEHLAEVKAQLPVEAPERLVSFENTAQHPLQNLDQAASALSEAIENNPNLASAITEYNIEQGDNILRVGTDDVSSTEALLAELLGPSAPLTVVYEPEMAEQISGRYRTSGRMRAGDGIYSPNKGLCTAGFGASEVRREKQTNVKIRARFLLSAGHCYFVDENVHRPSNSTGGEPWGDVGQVTRNAYLESHPLYPTDALAIRIKSNGVAPRVIFGSSGNPVPVGKPAMAKRGTILCYSGGKSSRVSCGPVSSVTTTPVASQLPSGPPTKWIKGYRVKFEKLPIGSDSGSPVWNPESKAAVGLAVGIFPKYGYAIVAPLLKHPKLVTPGILKVPSMYNIGITTSR